MTKTKHYTLKQRRINLISLISDSKKLGFSSHLIANYEEQLNEVEAEIQSIKENRIIVE